jgi:REP element-mobilizing transposase RayT
MTADACILDREQRQIVEKAVADHCLIRCWDLFAVNCRSNHVHVVVGGNCTPDDMRKQFKAWCTVRLKELEKVRRGTPGQATVRTNWWTERGSGLFINNEEDLETVFQYVRDAQDHPAK